MATASKLKFKVGDRVRVTPANGVYTFGQPPVGVITELLSDDYFSYAFQADYGQGTFRDDLAQIDPERAESYDIPMRADELEPE